ncbi:MAG: type I DNA topoisomerase [Lachnospiraceae bacterium]|nr:type I DNA topoisomerase [Lachnospiraceae bacterium]
MANNLVIVESPAKVNTVKKFLGSNYEVTASMGHIRDLPKSTLGIDTENDFEPKYITIRGKGQLVSDLKKAAKNADAVYLATDPDREGEAISWHLACALELDPKKMKRITFNEITKTAVKASLKQARELDMDLVDEQQARRCLDRMVGYKISPVLWKKVRRGLSAGRVQSVAVRIIADREDEINAFVPEEYWSLDAKLYTADKKKTFEAHFHGKGNRKTNLKCKQDVEEVRKTIEGAKYKVSDIKENDRIKKAPLPFTTSTLQQEASRLLNFSTSKTMRLAQQLYEGINIKGQGSVGLITYLRTDSVRVSDEADAAAKDFIRKQYGTNYVSGSRNTAAGSANVQDAHEAIRPTDITRTPASVKDDLGRDLFRLYQLIWKRFTASRMKNAVYNNANAVIMANGYSFHAQASKLTFEGFLAVYTQDDEKRETNAGVFALKNGDETPLKELAEEQHFTQPPAHYTEATLVRALEELGIGRPSTYAPTISTILSRHYISKEGRNLFVTELGEAVNNLMKEAFPNIVDVHFTADMEEKLDKVGDGTVNWKDVLRDYWPELVKSVSKAEAELSRVKIEDKVTDVICEKCGRNMVIKFGPRGQFLACPGFPECRNTKSIVEKAGADCPDCGAELIVRRTKKGRRYYACSNYPTCKYMTWTRPKKK